MVKVMISIIITAVIISRIIMMIINIFNSLNAERFNR